MLDENFYPSEVCKQYIQYLQEDIYAMRDNSAKCKALVCTLASALATAISVLQDRNHLFWFLLPLIILMVGWFMDAGFYAKEKDFVRKQKSYINLLIERSQNPNLKKEKEDQLMNNLFQFTQGLDCCQVLNGFFAWSVAGFYFPFIVAIVVAWCMK